MYVTSIYYFRLWDNWEHLVSEKCLHLPLFFVLTDSNWIQIGL